MKIQDLIQIHKDYISSNDLNLILNCKCIKNENKDLILKFEDKLECIISNKIIKWVKYYSK